MSGRRQTNFARGPIREPVNRPASRPWPRWLIEGPNYQELFDAAYECGRKMAEAKERAILDAITAEPLPGLAGQHAKLPRGGWPAAASYVTPEPEFMSRTQFILDEFAQAPVDAGFAAYLEQMKRQAAERLFFGPRVTDPRALLKDGNTA